MKPYLIELPATSGKGGKLSYLEEDKIPFTVRRVFWIYDISEKTTRGGHAHINSDQILICIQGDVQVSLENVTGERFMFHLKDPSEVLYFPKMHWMDMVCSKDAILMVLASNEYQESGYIKDYKHFNALKQ